MKTRVDLRPPVWPAPQGSPRADGAGCRTKESACGGGVEGQTQSLETLARTPTSKERNPASKRLQTAPEHGKVTRCEDSDHGLAPYTPITIYGPWGLAPNDHRELSLTGTAASAGRAANIYPG